MQKSRDLPTAKLRHIRFILGAISPLRSPPLSHPNPCSFSREPPEKTTLLTLACPKYKFSFSLFSLSSFLVSFFLNRARLVFASYMKGCFCWSPCKRTPVRCIVLMYDFFYLVVTVSLSKFSIVGRLSSPVQSYDQSFPYSIDYELATNLRRHPRNIN